MIDPLIGLHAGVGELGVIAFIWVFVELINPTQKRLERAKIVAVFGTILFFASWVFGGWYYLTDYGEVVKPLIKAGPMPWAHGLVTETKEHVFLFLPVLSLYITAFLYNTKDLLKDKKSQKAILILAGVIIVIGFLMLLGGYLISSGAREALQSSI